MTTLLRSCPKYIGVGALLLLAACVKSKHGPSYVLSADELAWQGYQAGEVLRFGHAKDGKVRTYLITEVTSAAETKYRGMNWVPLPQSPPPRYQHLKVWGLRTDTVMYVRKSNTDSVQLQAAPILDMELYKYRQEDTLQLRVDCDWELTFGEELPIQEVAIGKPIPPYYNQSVELLNSVQLGSHTYGPTLRVTPVYGGPSTPRRKWIRRLYFAKGAGVVGFEEDGTGLWYRL